MLSHDSVWTVDRASAVKLAPSLPADEEHAAAATVGRVRLAPADDAARETRAGVFRIARAMYDLASGHSVVAKIAEPMSLLECRAHGKTIRRTCA